MMNFDANYSRRIVLQLVVAGVLLAVLIVLARQFIFDFYIRDQQTYAGLITNGAILALFLAGLVKIVTGLRHYAREEAALARFLRAVDEERLDMMVGIERSRIIYRRYDAILKVSKQHAPVNHGALASLLLADESKRLTFPRFINNILILMGVFGTIVGLAIALVGAADLMEAKQNLGTLDVLIHAMSVALSTTITAIVCYLFFSYFYLKLNDAQTHLISGVEQITSLYLLPEFSRDANSIVHEVASLIEQLRETTDGMRSSQSEYAEAGVRLRETVHDFAHVGHRMSIMLAELDERVSGITDDMRVIKGMLRDGFRLPA
jgi:MotA/TolQ/ExbB proton channel family protein